MCRSAHVMGFVQGEGPAPQTIWGEGGIGRLVLRSAGMTSRGDLQVTLMSLLGVPLRGQEVSSLGPPKGLWRQVGLSPAWLLCT